MSLPRRKLVIWEACAKGLLVSPSYQNGQRCHLDPIHRFFVQLRAIYNLREDHSKHQDSGMDRDGLGLKECLSIKTAMSSNTWKTSTFIHFTVIHS